MDPTARCSKSHLLTHGFTPCYWRTVPFLNQHRASAISLQGRSNCFCHCPIYLHFYFCIDGYHTPQRASPAVKWHRTGNLIIIWVHVWILFNPFVTLHCFLITSSSDRSALCTRTAWEPPGNSLRDKVSPGRSGQRCLLASEGVLLTLCQAWILTNLSSMHKKTSAPLSVVREKCWGLWYSTGTSLVHAVTWRCLLLHVTTMESALWYSSLCTFIFFLLICTKTTPKYLLKMMWLVLAGCTPD